MSISGFMIIKNGISGGYPFIEAILSVLSICNEFLVSDGFSVDGTWEALKKLSEKYSKIKLYHDIWHGKKKKGEILAEMTNILKGRCKGDYCLYVQGNEIYHEEIINKISELPEIYPRVEMFSFPFRNIIGEKYVFHYDDFRVRLIKNLPEIIARGDAWTLGYNIKELAIRNPYKLFIYLKNKELIRRHIYLNYPVYRYYALFPENYINKLKMHLKIYTDRKIASDIKLMYKLCLKLKNKRYKCPEKFWDSFVHSIWPKLSLLNPFLPKKLSYLTIDDHPKIMKPLFGRWKYFNGGSPVQSTID